MSDAEIGAIELGGTNPAHSACARSLHPPHQNRDFAKISLGANILMRKSCGFGSASVGCLLPTTWNSRNGIFAAAVNKTRGGAQDRRAGDCEDYGVHSAASWQNPLLRWESATRCAAAHMRVSRDPSEQQQMSGNGTNLCVKRNGDGSSAENAIRWLVQSCNYDRNSKFSS